MRAVLVTGDRHATVEIWEPVIARASKLIPADDQHLVVIHGDAPGIDSIAGAYFRRCNDVAVVPVPAQWDKHGKAAGPRRNQAMLNILLTLRDHGYTVGVFAFHDTFDQSRGTKQMVGIAKAAGVPVKLFRSTEPTT